MNPKPISFLASASMALMVATSAFAAGTGLPGDTGKPNGDGIMAVNPAPRAPTPPQPLPAAVPVEVALKAAQAIAAGCKQYPLGIAIVNAEGAPILTYIPNGSKTMHTYGSIRKAYSAVKFNANSSTMIKKAQEDPAFAAQVKADPALVAYGGGILLKAGDKVLGAIGVSGAEPGGHDEECGLIGLNAIKDQLK